MQKALLSVVAVGALIGVAMPTGGSGPAADPPAETATDPEAQQSGWAAETRLERRGNGHFYVDAMVDGQIVDFMIDTGASGVVLTVEDAERIGIPVDPHDFVVIGSGASGAVRGRLLRFDRIAVDGKEVRDVDGAVAEGLTQSLLGQSYLSRIGGVQMSGEYMVLR